ncbi:MAG: metallophosphoesterase family protein [Armatimonadota bacterium]|nr:metallophosphoesterase family protein [Armatimonadota bacterium]
MRILACADLHGKPERIARVRALVAEHAPDVLLLPGDLTHVDQGADALDLLRTLPIPVLAIPGNMDGSLALDAIRRHGGLAGPKPLVLQGISFGGPAATESCDVLVTHEPPQGTLDRVSMGKHAGSRRVLELLMRLRPRVLTCGHIHESPGIERVGGTLVVNCTMGDGKTGGALIEITGDRVDARLLGIG